MFRYVKKCIIILTLFWACFLIALQLPYIHRNVIRGVEKWASSLIEQPVHISSLNGLLPFYISLSDVRIGDEKEPLFYAQNVHLVPAWPDLLLGHIAFYHLGISTPHIDSKTDTTAFSIKSNELPRIAIYSFSLHHIHLDKEYSAKGRFFFNPRKLNAHTAFQITSEEGPGPARSLQCTMKVTKDNSSATLKCTVPDIQVHDIDAATTKIELISEELPLLLWNLPSKKPHSLCQGIVRGSVHLKGDAENCHYYTTFDLKSENALDIILRSFSTTNVSFCGPLSLNLVKDKNGLTIRSKTNVATVNGIVISHLEATNLIHSSKGSTQLQATLSSLPLSLNATWSLKNGQTDEKAFFSLNSFALTLGKTNLKGNFSAQFSPFRISGTLTGTSNNLSDLSSIVGKTLSGKAQILSNFNYANENQVQNFTAALHLENVKSGSTHIQDGNCDIQGQAEWPRFSLSSKLIGKQCTYKHFQFDSLSLNNTVSFDSQLSTTFDIDSTGTVDVGPFALQAKGTIDPNNFELSACKFRINNKEGILNKPIVATKSSSSYEVKPFEMEFNKGEGSLSGFINASTEHLGLNLHALNVPLEPLHLFYPTLICAGSLSGDVDASFDAAILNVHGHFESESLSLTSGQPANAIQPLQAEVEIAANNTLAQLSGEITTEAAHPLQFTIEIPLQITHIPVVQIDVAHFLPLRGKVSGQLNIAPLFLPLIEEDECVEGIINSDITIGGTIDFPSYSGKATLKKGRLEMLKTGELLADVNAEGVFSGNKVQITSCTATDEKGGNATATGAFELSLEKSFPFSSEIQANHMEVIRRDFATATGTGKVSICGNFKEALLKGACVVDSAELNIGNDISKDIPSIDIAFVDENKSEDLKNNDQFTFNFDLDIDLPASKGSIVGRGLTSTWKGAMKLLGPHHNLIGRGKLCSQAGSFVFGGKEFTLKPSSVEFAGDIFTDAQLNIHASYDVGTFEAELILRGSFDKPRLAFTSTSGFSEREILSWIIFNKPLTEVSPLESLQLANLLVDANPETKFNLIEKLKQRLGIEIGITKSNTQSPTDPSDAVTVQVSKYLSDSLILKLSKDVANAVNRVGVQANLRKNVSVQAEVGDDSQGNVSVKWKQDY